MCDMAFVQKQQLVSHKRRRHNELPFRKSINEVSEPLTHSSIDHLAAQQPPSTQFEQYHQEGRSSTLFSEMLDEGHGHNKTFKQYSQTANEASTVRNIRASTSGPSSDTAPLAHLSALAHSPRSGR